MFLPEAKGSTRKCSFQPFQEVRIKNRVRWTRSEKQKHGTSRIRMDGRRLNRVGNDKGKEGSVGGYTLPLARNHQAASGSDDV